MLNERFPLFSDWQNTLMAWKRKLEYLFSVIDGKIIEETGSNANGRYVKYTDGTMTCYLTHGLTIPTGDVTAAGTVTLPASFVDTNYIWVATQGTAHGSYIAATATWGQNNTKAVDSFSVHTQMSGTIGVDVVVKANIIAIGQWK